MKRFSAVLVCMIIFALLAALALPLAIANDVQYTFLNPLGEVVPPYNHPLAERPESLSEKSVLVQWYNSTSATSTSGNLYPTTHIVIDLATTIRNQILANAPGSTVVLQSTSTATLGLGSPFEVKTPAQYNAWAAAYDAVVIIADDNVGVWMAAYHAKELEVRGTPAVVVTTGFFETGLVRSALENGLTSMRYVALDTSAVALQYRAAAGATRQNNILNEVINPFGVTASLIAALTAPLTPAEAAPPAITPADLSSLVAKTYTVSGQSHGEALQAFHDLSMEKKFGDGLPLLIPTQALVDDMLAATPRNGDEIIGVLRGGGIVTVEKVAINAVMAAARPDHFPVILAAVEALAGDLEDGMMFDVALRNSANTTIVLLVSGPITRELRINDERTYYGGTRESNTIIGRALALAWRNIGHNYAEDTSVRGAFARLNDHAPLVAAENLQGLPRDWRPHTQEIGLGDANSNSITLIASSQQAAMGRTSFGNAHKLTITASTYAITGTPIAGFRTSAGVTTLTANPQVTIVSVNESYARWLAAAPTGTSGQTAMQRALVTPKNLDEAYGGLNLFTKNLLQREIVNTATEANHKLVWPMSITADPGGIRTFNGSGIMSFGLGGFQTQLISGLGDAVVSSAPRNAQARIVSAPDAQDVVRLTWEAPARVGGEYVTYQVSGDGGVTWINVDGLSYDFALTNNLGTLYVRQITNHRNAANIGLVGSVYDVVYSSGGRGAWAAAAVIAE